MAKYNLENYLDKDGLGFPLNFRRGNPNPLDNSSVWKGFAEAQNYAQTDPTAYVGQILSVVNYTAAVLDDEGGVVTPSQSTVEVYYIKDEAGNLEPVGTSPVGDEGTITVAEDGTVSLYGIAGLALTREEEGGEVVNITYQPLYVNGKLTWVEPSATTVEGLAAEIEGLKTRISALETAVGDAEGGLVKDVADHGEAIEALDTKIGEVAEGKTVVEMISDAQAAATYDDTDVKADIEALDDLIGGEAVSVQVGREATRAQGVESGLDTRLKVVEDDYLTSTDKEELADADADQVERIEALEETIVGLSGAMHFEGIVESDPTAEGFDVAGYEKGDVVIFGNKEYVFNDGKFVEFGDVSAQAEAITDLTGRMDDADGEIEDLQGEVEAINHAENGILAQAKGYADSLAGNYDAAGTAEDKVNALANGAVADNAAAIDALETLVGTEPVAEQITNVTDKKVDKAEGYRLMSDAEGDKLAGIAEGANVNVIDTVDETQFGLENNHLTLLDIAMGKVTGLSDALAGKVDKVEGQRLLTEDEATKLEKLVLGENGEVSVSGKVAAGNVDGLDAWITARAATLKGLSENNLTDTLLSKLNGIAEGAQVNVIDTVSDEFTVTGKNLAVKAISQDKITGLSDALAGKVDAEEGYRLISEAEHEKLAKIAEGAQVNVLEGVKIGDTLLSIVDKIVTIPVGGDALGVVKSSDAENKVAIAADGVMEVNSVNVNKLVQDEGSYLILNGGAASL